MFQTSTRRVRGDGSSLPGWLHLLALVAAALAGVFAFPIATKAAPQVGAEAPDFALKSTGGKNLRLSEYRGDVVVLTFWASWCGECRQTLAALDHYGAQSAADAPIVIGINIDGDVDRAASVARSAGFRHPTLVDSRQRVGRLYDIDHLPLTLVLDRQGIVRGAWSRDEVPGADLDALLKELAGS